MKKKSAKNPEARAHPQEEICLEFTHPTAAAVCVAGTFNEWRPEATLMVSMGDGCWMKQLVLPPGSYEYCLVVDGKWMPDPLAKETSPHPFGGVNSVLRVSAPT